MRTADRLLASMIRHDIRGARTVGRFLNRREIASRSSFGGLFHLRPGDYIDRCVIRHGYYESEVVTAMVSDVARGAVIWDVGANFGLHAVTAKMLRPDVTVVCIEPSPDQASRIISHCDLNNVQMQLVLAGLGDDHRFSTLNIVREGNPGMTTFQPWAQASYSHTLTACVTSGDRLVAEGTVPAPDVIKLDVEGFEAAALSGLGHTLRSRHPRLILEGSTETAKLVGDFGYSELNALDRAEPTHHALTNFVAM